MGAKSVLIKNEEDQVCKYLDDMFSCGLFINPFQLKCKVYEIVQNRETTIKYGLFSDIWMRWPSKRDIQSIV